MYFAGNAKSALFSAKQTVIDDTDFECAIEGHP